MLSPSVQTRTPYGRNFETMDQFYSEGIDCEVVIPSFDPMDVNVDRGGADDGSISFYASEFPTLPGFTCMSSSSSNGALVKAASSTSLPSSSSVGSWARVGFDQVVDEDRSPPVQLQVPSLVAIPLSSALSSTGSKEFLDCKSEYDRFKKEDERKAEVAFEDCFEAMEESTLGYMELLDCTKLFDPDFMFDVEATTDADASYSVEQFQEQHHLQQLDHQTNFPPSEGTNVLDPESWESVIPPYDGLLEQPVEVEAKPEATVEMGQVLMEWLKTNRDSISADDLRKVKIKKATIESAARRLGGGKAAMKQLLKLILEWVQTNNQYRKRKEAGAQTKLEYPPFPHQDHMLDPSSFLSHKPRMLDPGFNSFTIDPVLTCFPCQPQWEASPCMIDHTGPVMAAPPTYSSSAVGYNTGASGPFSNSGELYPGHPRLADYQMLESPHSWLMSQFRATPKYINCMSSDMNFQPAAKQGLTGYGNNSPQYSNLPQQYCSGGNGGGHTATKAGSSATKEARKKRMARQRRLMSHQHHRNNTGNHASHQNRHPRVTVMAMGMDHQHHSRFRVCDQPAESPDSGNWIQWSGPAPPQAKPVEAMQVHQAPLELQPALQGQNGQWAGQLALDRRLGSKPENNLKFLLQKVLKQSDVGNLGRIVLPKKEAETHLPELESRDGISISMEDIGTSRVWNMRYRFWPNNKSRMYLLENTGDFVRVNGLQEGDFIVIYSDIKYGKYLIRGVKVQQQPEGGAKSDPKKLEHCKTQKNKLFLCS